MKSILTMATAALIMTSVAFGSGEEQADNLYTQRGQSVAYAEQAASLYAQLAEAESDTLKRAQLKIKESEATYYVGTQAQRSKDKQEIHDRGQKIAMVAVGLLSGAPGVAAKDEFKTDLARAYYFYGANLGKWGEAKGVLASLGKWPELKDNMFKLIANDESVEDYGAYRILGKAFLKVPFESSAQGLEYLRKAYDSTKVTVKDMTLSRNSTTAYYFLEGLKKQEEIETFCGVFSEYSKLAKMNDQELTEYNSAKLPETKGDIAKFKGDKDLQEYASDECI